MSLDSTNHNRVGLQYLNWKKTEYKGTSTFKICVVQGSTVFIILLWSECLCPWNIHKWMVLGSEAVGRWLSHEGGAFMNEITALIKETPENQLTASSTWGSREICGLGEGIHRSWWHLRLPGSRTVRNKFAYKPPGLWHLCSRDPERPKQLYILFFFSILNITYFLIQIFFPQNFQHSDDGCYLNPSLLEQSIN